MAPAVTELTCHFLPLVFGDGRAPPSRIDVKPNNHARSACRYEYIIGCQHKIRNCTYQSKNFILEYFFPPDVILRIENGRKHGISGIRIIVLE